MVKQRSENGFGFQWPGLKTGVENGMFWSEIGSGFGELGGTPLPKIPRSTTPPPIPGSMRWQDMRNAKSMGKVATQT